MFDNVQRLIGRAMTGLLAGHSSPSPCSAFIEIPAGRMGRGRCR